MAVPFSNTKLRVPKGFQNILEGLAREVLRNQPENIFEFGAKYFDQLLKVREETGHDPAVHGARLEDRFYNNDAFKRPTVDANDPQQQEAATKIQTEFRRHSAKKEVDSLREEAAATTIQAGVRGQQEREKVADIAKQAEEEVDIDLKDPEVEAAAVKIQAGFKGYKARKDVKDAKEKKEDLKFDQDNQELHDAATTIQAGFKGHLVRLELKAKKEEKEGQDKLDQETPTEATKETQEEKVDIDLKDPEVDKAAAKIQAGFKGYKVRQELKSKSETDVKTDEVKEEVDIDLKDPEVEKAATAIQAGFKGYKVRKELQDKKDEAASKEEEAPKQKEEEKVDIDLEDPETAQAALKIQAGFRGYKTRKEVQETLKKDGDQPEQIPEEKEQSEDKPQEAAGADSKDIDVDKAATKIQAGFKGYKVRKDMKEKEGKTEEAASGDDSTKPEEASKSEEAPKTQEEGQKEEAPAPEGDAAKTGEEEAKTEEQAPTEEQAKTEDKPSEKRKKEVNIELKPEEADKVMAALSRFPSFKQPEKAPDSIKLSEKNVKRVMKWRSLAKKNSENPTYTGMQKVALKTRRTFSDLSVFGFEMEKNSTKEETKTKTEKEVIAEDENETIKDDKENANRTRTASPVSNAGTDSDFDSSDSDFDSDHDLDDDAFGRAFGNNVLKGFDGRNFFGNMLQGDPHGDAGKELGGVMNNLTDMVTGMAPMMSAMLNKSLTYAPTKAAKDTLEKWLAENRNILRPEQIEKKEKQIEIYGDILALYDEEQDDDEQHVKEARGSRVMEMYQEIEKLGALPVEVTEAQNEAAKENFEGDTSQQISSQLDAMGTMMTQMMGQMFSGGPSATQPSREETANNMLNMGDGGGDPDCTIL